MTDTYWLKQTDKPLFPDVLWNKPENRRQAGKLLIVGGNLHRFAAVSQAYGFAVKAGVGTARAVLPDALSRTLGKVFPEAEFAASTPSGSFGRDALATLIDAAEWADGVLLAGDFGKNSETAVLLESFAGKYKGVLVIADDGLDYFASAKEVSDQNRTALVLDLARLQKLAAHHQIVIKHSDDLAHIVEKCRDLCLALSCTLVTEQDGQLIVAHRGRVSTTKSGAGLPAAATHASVWLLQQPNQPFEALTSAIYCLIDG